MTQTMTKNEYKKYCQDIVCKVSAEEFYKMIESVKVLPFDFTFHPQLNKVTQKWINAVCDEENNLFGNGTLYTGLLINSYWSLGQKMNLNAGVLESYSGFYYDDEQMLILSYCEGDIYIYVFSDEQLYKEELKRNYTWFSSDDR